MAFISDMRTDLYLFSSLGSMQTCHPQSFRRESELDKKSKFHIYKPMFDTTSQNQAFVIEISCVVMIILRMNVTLAYMYDRLFII